MKPSEMVGAEYGLSDRTISRLIRIHSLNESLKEWIDSGELSVRAGVTLSYLPSETQECLYYACVNENDSNMRRKIDMKTAERIRAEFENRDDVDENSFEHFFKKPQITSAFKPIKVSSDIRSKFFTADTSQKEIEETIEKALKAYFKKK
jgi:ParB family chromosome partitioning protein